MANSPATKLNPGSQCQASVAKKLATIEIKCGTAGTEALATVEAAVVLSGANTAAPAMVILSTLVGVLAIFA